MRLSSFFRHCETDFFRIYCSSHQFLIFCNRMDVQKIPKRPRFYIFRHYATYRKLQKNSEKNSEIFNSIFSFLKAFVVSSCRKSVFRFRVFLSLRYDADLFFLFKMWRTIQLRYHHHHQHHHLRLLSSVWRCMTRMPGWTN